jgi:hypothetical protein
MIPHLNLVLRLRMQGTILLLVKHVVIAWCLIKQWILLYDVLISIGTNLFLLLLM